MDSVHATDTCAIWNMIGAPTLFRASRGSGLSFLITQTVYYECFSKSRNRPPSDTHLRLRATLERLLFEDEVSRMDVSIADLQDVLHFAREHGVDKRLGHGELSCVALARRLPCALLTDNKRDFSGIETLLERSVRTTPRILQELFTDGRLSDGDINAILTEHGRSEGHIGKWLHAAYELACAERLRRSSS